MAFLEIATSINWPAWIFALIVGAGVIFMLRLDRDPTLTFRLVQFISVDGEANSWALARVTGLLTTTWVVWYETLHGRLSEWLILAYLGTVFAASVWTATTAAKERTEKVKVDAGILDPPPSKPVEITENSTRRTEVTR